MWRMHRTAEADSSLSSPATEDGVNSVTISLYNGILCTNFINRCSSPSRLPGPRRQSDKTLWLSADSAGFQHEAFPVHSRQRNRHEAVVNLL
jgi:hypothetical protein